MPFLYLPTSEQNQNGSFDFRARQAGNERERVTPNTSTANMYSGN